MILAARSPTNPLQHRKNSGRGSLFCILLAITVSLGLSSCAVPSPEQMVTFSGKIMGTDYRITTVLAASTNEQAIEHAALAAMQAVNQSMSTYLPDSELSQINGLPADVTLALSDGLYRVLLEAQRISELSDGAFDVTLAKAIDLWGFGPNGAITARPESETLATLKDSVGYELIELKDGRIRKRHAEVAISLSAIAKGYAVDQVADTLRANGVSSFLINIGGELRAAGLKPDGSSWKVGIEKPHILGGIEQVVALNDSAIATSGDYRNYHVIDGQRLSHTLDPKTLSPVFHRLALVSVTHPSAMTADALATALMAMGEQRALDFAEEQSLAAYFVIREGSEAQYRIEMTESFRRNLQ